MSWQDERRARRTNRILAVLPADCRERLDPSLEPIELRRGNEIQTAGRQIDHMYFVDEGLVSLLKTMTDGRAIEVAAVGVEGLVGWSAIMGTGVAAVDAIVQLPGSARRIALARFRDEMNRSAAFRTLVLRYIETATAQFVQTAACNSIHSVDQRFCRWVLIAHDSLHSDSLSLTHELIASMLGVQRASISLAAAALQRSGIVEYRHGRMTVTDRRALEARACECYGAIRAHFDDLIRS